MSQVRIWLAATSVGNYALFAGGLQYHTPEYNQTAHYSTVDAYNSSLTRSTPTALSEARSYLAATTVGNYALFGGGWGSSSNYSTVDAYNSSLTRSTATELSQVRYGLAATTVGNYALFGGGVNANYLSTVDAYNSSLTRSTPTALSQVRYKLAATTVGNYALFGGGYDGSSTFPNVDAYNSSLTRSIATALSQVRYKLAATTVGNYALFGGGYGGNYLSAVDAYENVVANMQATVFKGSKYKFQNMTAEATATSNVESISIPTPATGYIKFKNTTIS